MEISDTWLWIFSGAFSIIFALLIFLWKSMHTLFAASEQRTESRFNKLDNRLDRQDNILLDVDRRLCRLEGAFASKDCCVIKDERHIKKAE